MMILVSATLCTLPLPSCSPSLLVISSATFLRPFVPCPLTLSTTLCLSLLSLSFPPSTTGGYSSSSDALPFSMAEFVLSTPRSPKLTQVSVYALYFNNDFQRYQLPTGSYERDGMS